MTFQNPDVQLSEAEAHALDQELLTRIWSEERAAEARHGGRAITSKLARRVTVLRRAADPNDSLDWATAWHYNIDPAGGGWDGYAGTLSRGYDASARPVFLSAAEDMLVWPIYRAAIARQVEEQAYVAGAMATHANIAANDRFAREALIAGVEAELLEQRTVKVMKAMSRTALTGKRATPGVAATIARAANPTVEEIADILYLSGSKGGKLAALGVAKDILTELEA